MLNNELVFTIIITVIAGIILGIGKFVFNKSREYVRSKQSTYSNTAFDKTFDFFENIRCDIKFIWSIIFLAILFFLAYNYISADIISEFFANKLWSILILVYVLAISATIYYIILFMAYVIIWIMLYIMFKW